MQETELFGGRTSRRRGGACCTLHEHHNASTRVSAPSSPLTRPHLPHTRPRRHAQLQHCVTAVTAHRALATPLTLMQLRANFGCLCHDEGVAGAEGILLGALEPALVTSLHIVSGISRRIAPVCDNSIATQRCIASRLESNTGASAEEGHAWNLRMYRLPSEPTVALMIWWRPPSSPSALHPQQHLAAC